MTNNPHIPAPQQIPLGKKVHPDLDALDLALRRVRIRALRRTHWLQHLLAEAQAEDSQANFHQLVLDILDAKDSVEAEREWLEDAPDIAGLNEELAWVEAQIAQDQSSRLAKLVFHFGLSHAEVALLHTCLAWSLDPSLDRVFSYLQDHNSRNFATLPLVSRLFAFEAPLETLQIAQLLKWDFVQEKSLGRAEPSLYQMDPWLYFWLQGNDQLDPVLHGLASFPSGFRPLSNWPLEKTTATIQKIVAHNPLQLLRIAVKGVEGSGRQSFAASIASSFKLHLMVLNVDGIGTDDWENIYLHAQRQAQLNGYAIAWRGDDLPSRDWPGKVPPLQLQFLLMRNNQVAKSQATVLDREVDLPMPGIALRHQLWAQYLPESLKWESEKLDYLVTQYRATPKQIAAIAAHAPGSMEEAVELLRQGNRHQLGKLAQIVNSDYSWEDVSLHPNLLESLQDFVFEAQDREKFWEAEAGSRIFPQGRGLMALFAGPSGTGKTMTAQVIANSLQLDLYRIDLSSVISKYVGETSKHIDKILSMAQSMHGVLLFDEADTLFGKRTEIKDAHDRYANADTNYLLQAIENYPGIAILATNRKANIDPAFLRRLRFVFEFIKPDAAQRLRLWEKLVTEMAGEASCQKMAPGLRQLAELADLTGAQIKYAILTAVFMARRSQRDLELTHLVKAIDRELAKEGKSLSPETLRRLDFFRR